MSELHKLSMMENVVTLIVCGAIVLGLYAMGAGGWALWGLLLLFNLSTVRTTKSDSQ